MIVTPKLHPNWAFDSPKLVTIGSDQPHNILIECVVLSPPSVKGRTVYVQITTEQITPLLLEVREVAMAMRR